jgi:hypothetical protein
LALVLVPTRSTLVGLTTDSILHNKTTTTTKQTMSNETSLTVGCGVGGSGVAGIGVGDVCCAKIHHKFTIESIERQHQ